MKLTVACPEGFSYISFQRIIITDQDGNNISNYVADKINSGIDDPRDKLYNSDGCFFVESGESFCLEDFACFVEDVYPDAEVICVDGDET